MTFRCSVLKLLGFLQHQSPACFCEMTESAHQLAALTCAMLQVPASDEKAQTVYTVRMCTGSARGSGMTEQRAAVWLGLVGQDGSSYLHRAVPLSDPDVIEQELIQICQVTVCSSFWKLMLCQAHVS